MELGLRDRVAVVTGASSGLGKAVARELSREKARVVIASRNEARLRQTADEIRRETGGQIVAVPTDVTQPQAVESLVEATLERWGRIDIALANSGGPPSGSYDSIGIEQFERALQLNLMSTLYLAKAVTPHMKQNGWGRFIALTSLTVKQPLPGLVLSNTARAGVVGLVKTMATELAPFGVLCNVVAPGWIRTARVEELFSARADREGREPEEIMEEIQGRIPLGRLGRPEELADLIVFLASERASYLTGATIQVDGGYIQSLL
ncbi:MAG: SDR family oxidoreductase [Gemmatimonadota bacterium]|jgi:3-oxoacyl-[acyl-carrier protein] reductase|nr:SDR family oxidoreductase [Gemmatimonadota bacterium]